MCMFLKLRFVCVHAVAFVALLWVTGVAAQEPAIVVTAEDVEIRFPTAEDPANSDWHAATVLSISYSGEPLGSHVPTARIGNQKWGAQMPDSTAAGFKMVVVIITVAALPSPSDRKMEFRLRARYEGTTTTSPFSDVESVHIIGKPGKPNQTGP